MTRFALPANHNFATCVHAYKVKHCLPSIDTNRPNLHWNTSCPHLYTKGLRRRTMPVVLGQSSIVTTDPYFGNGRGFFNRRYGDFLHRR